MALLSIFEGIRATATRSCGCQGLFSLRSVQPPLVVIRSGFIPDLELVDTLSAFGLCRREWGRRAPRVCSEVNSLWQTTLHVPTTTAAARTGPASPSSLHCDCLVVRKRGFVVDVLARATSAAGLAFLARVARCASSTRLCVACAPVHRAPRKKRIQRAMRGCTRQRSSRFTRLVGSTHARDATLTELGRLLCVFPFNGSWLQCCACVDTVSSSWLPHLLAHSHGCVCHTRPRLRRCCRFKPESGRNYIVSPRTMAAAAHRVARAMRRPRRAPAAADPRAAAQCGGRLSRARPVLRFFFAGGNASARARQATRDVSAPRRPPATALVRCGATHRSDGRPTTL